MRGLSRSYRSLLLALVVLVAVAPGSALAQQDKEPGGNEPEDELPTVQPRTDQEAAPDRVIVKFKEESSSAERSDARREEGLEKKKDLDLIDAEVDKVKGQSVEQVVRDLERRPDVEYAEPDHIVRPTGGYADESRFADLWGLDNTGQAINGLIRLALLTST